MSEIYIRDLLIPKLSDGRGPRRSQDDINAIITSIIPRPTTSMRTVKLGFTIAYPNEEDANFFFKIINYKRINFFIQFLGP